MRARGYAPFASSADNDALMDSIIARAAPGKAAVFDLDGCLFDTRPRQVRIFRELAAQEGWRELWLVREEHFLDWSLKTTMLNAGISADWVEVHEPLVRAWWTKCFFSSPYVIYDHAMPGAPSLVREVWERGAQVVYLTGRDVTMAPGTEISLRAFGFPYNAVRTSLLVKPQFGMDDTEFKDSALESIADLGETSIYLDNEPANVNLFKRRHPDSHVVFVETDHSPRPDEPAAAIPWLRSFWRTA